MSRDLSDTQVRIDYSNENTHWSTIVDKAADANKRSLKRSAKTFQDSSKAMHKRWFSETTLSQPKVIFTGVTNIDFETKMKFVE
ncbi:hypothetical protein QQZ08_008489 [Neonectria magnoliae]|uniref:Uncharacterized protein n=1 Tax=Neonectria magnoliae TaxID=2732573 RepID=A0ABR1HV68_9HYPO